MADRQVEFREVGGGLLLVAIGSFMILLIFAFASMVDPQLTGNEWWAEVTAHIGAGGGWPVICWGGILVLFGFFLVIRSVFFALSGASKPSGRDDPLDV